MLAGAFSNALLTLLGALLVLGAILVYLTLIRQIRVRRAAIMLEPGIVPPRTFGLPEALLAAVLVLFLLMNVTASIERGSPVQLSDRDLFANFLLSLVIIFFVGGFLKLRGFDIDSLAGFSKTSVKRAISIAVVLLLAAAPLILLAEVFTQSLFGGQSSRQEIVDLFNNSSTITQRVMIIILAVVVAPISEEFIFRFFLYGVLRRYFGIAVALLFNSLLFAAAHTHLPSAAPLFVLGACFTLAYEWSGSILVSMSMHTLFNSVQLVFLAFPDLFPQ
jgi:CAAX protease family protein